MAFKSLQCTISSKKDNIAKSKNFYNFKPDASQVIHLIIFKIFTMSSLPPDEKLGNGSNVKNIQVAFILGISVVAILIFLFKGCNGA
jgi:hypothetical protein